jgi:uncharacterized protein (TIGR03435 family)
MRGGQLRGTRYEVRNATMVDLIRTAYNVQPEKITGGPTWLEWNRFDIAALAPEKTPPDRLREMLKTLLAERFKLAVREDTVTTTAMALKVKGTHKLKESSTAGGGCQGQGAPEPNGVIATTATCTGMSMAQLADQLPRAQSAYFPNGQQLIDETGLSGFWDFQIKFTPRQLLGQAGSDGITLQAALEKIGLIMEPKDIKVPAIVVDTATAQFTPNPADVNKRLPPLPPPQFEVAVLKPSPPDATQPRAQLRPTGQVDASAAPLNRVFGLAWSLPDNFLAQFLVAPKWIETYRIDVTARAFADTNPANNAQADEDLVRMMLRSLLIERFQIKWHMEDRPGPRVHDRGRRPEDDEGRSGQTHAVFRRGASGVTCSRQAAAVPEAGDVRERHDGAVRPVDSADRGWIHARGSARQDRPAGWLRFHAQFQPDRAGAGSPARRRHCQQWYGAGSYGRVVTAGGRQKTAWPEARRREAAGAGPGDRLDQRDAAG